MTETVDIEIALHSREIRYLANLIEERGRASQERHEDLLKKFTRLEENQQACNAKVTYWETRVGNARFFVQVLAWFGGAVFTLIGAVYAALKLHHDFIK